MLINIFHVLGTALITNGARTELSLAGRTQKLGRFICHSRPILTLMLHFKYARVLSSHVWVEHNSVQKLRMVHPLVVHQGVLVRYWYGLIDTMRVVSIFIGDYLCKVGAHDTPLKPSGTDLSMYISVWSCGVPRRLTKQLDTNFCCRYNKYRKCWVFKYIATILHGFPKWILELIMEVF